MILIDTKLKMSNTKINSDFQLRASYCPTFNLKHTKTDTSVDGTNDYPKTHSLKEGQQPQVPKRHTVIWIDTKPERSNAKINFDFKLRSNWCP